MALHFPLKGFPGSARFLFVRHAESTANVLPLVQDHDPVLTERGSRQAEELAHRLSACDVQAIYTSGTSRARSTARPLELRVGVERREMPEIDEWNLGAGGRVEETKLHAMFDLWRAGHRAARLEGAPRSESLEELQARVVPVFQDIFDRHERDEGLIVVIAHGGSISWTMPAFAGNVSLRFAIQTYLGNARAVLVVSRNGRPRVAQWDDVSFAECGPL